jgi:hypothetical protein
MWDEDYGFALRVWLGWLSSNSIRISSGCFHPVFREQRYEPPSTRKPRSSSTTTNTRRKESQPKPGSDIEQPPQAIVWTRSRNRDRPAVLKHHIWRPVQSTSKTPCHQPSTQTFAPGAAPYVRACEQAMPTKHHRRSSGAAHIHREAEKQEPEVVNETRTPRE